MELSVLKKPKLVVALDIGSTYSGYALQWREDFERNPSNIEVSKLWDVGGMEWHKTTTCLLLDTDKKVDSFGFLAEERYCDSLDQADNDSEVIDKWYFFKFFKMILYNRQGIQDDQLVDDYFGQPMLLMDVMSAFIGALRNDCLEKRLGRHAIDEKDILWVLTVPAIWTESAKKFMRTAAEKSGIAPRNLLLALEPEAAAIHCMFLPQEEKGALEDIGQIGSKFIVADLGGGTADVSALEVLEGGFLKEITCGGGARGGGQDVNNAFFQDLRDRFPGKETEKYWASSRLGLFDMETDFERHKLEIGHDTERRDETITVKLPDEFKENLKNGTFRFTESEGFKKSKGQIMYESGYIREKLFEQVVGMVVQPILDVLHSDDAGGVRHVVLVGGFAESVVVRQKIEEKLRGMKAKVLVPTSPLDAVMKGAVLYGHNPLIFRSRISKFTYGIGVNGMFKDGVHDESRKFINEDGAVRCRNVFDVHVRINESVVLNEQQPTRTYHPLSKNSRCVAINVYSSTSSSPTYVTDTGCEQLGSIQVDMPDTTGGTGRQVKVTMIYGGTELAVEAVDVTTGKEFKTRIQF